MNIKILCLSFVLVFTLNLSAHEEDGIFLPHSHLVSQVVWSPDGTKLAAYVWPEIYVYNTETWEYIVITEAGTSDMAWHPDSQLIAGVQGGASERVLIWDASIGELVREFGRLLPSDIHQVPQPQTISWHPNGNIIATDSSVFEDEILLWDVRDTDNVIEPRRLDIAVDTFHNSTNLIWSQNGEMLLSSGMDDLPPNPNNFMTTPSAYIIDSISGEVRFSLETGVYVWAPDDSRVIIGTTADSLHRLIIWNLLLQEEEVHFDAHTASVLDVAWNSQSHVIASGDIDGNLFIWNTDSGLLYASEEFEAMDLRDLAWKPNSNSLAIGAGDGIFIQTFDFD